MVKLEIIFLKLKQSIGKYWEQSFGLITTTLYLLILKTVSNI